MKVIRSSGVRTLTSRIMRRSAASACLRVSPSLEPGRPGRPELALDLPVADPPLPVPRAAFLDDRAGAVRALVSAFRTHRLTLAPFPPGGPWRVSSSQRARSSALKRT